MPTFRFVVAYRKSDGMLTPPLYEQAIEAANAREAVEQAKRIDVEVSKLGGNALYLTDEQGTVLWSLRLADQSNAATPV